MIPLAVAKAFVGRIPPEVWRLLIVILLVVLYSFYWYHKGVEHTEEKYAKINARQASLIQSLRTKQTKITERVVVQYRDRVQTVYKQGQTIIKEVPVVITKEADAACVVPVGFVRLWNDSNQGSLSRPTSGADAAPSDVVLSDIAAQKSRESVVCKKEEEQLFALKAWVQAQKAANP